MCRESRKLRRLIFSMIFTIYVGRKFGKITVYFSTLLFALLVRFSVRWSSGTKIFTAEFPADIQPHDGTMYVISGVFGVSRVAEETSCIFYSFCDWYIHTYDVVWQNNGQFFDFVLCVSTKRYSSVSMSTDPVD